jgi:hypothetical protein
MPRKEKNDISVKLWLPESLYEDLVDLAVSRDLSLSEYVRKSLEVDTYGSLHKLRVQRARQSGRGESGRGGVIK